MNISTRYLWIFAIGANILVLVLFVAIAALHSTAVLPITLIATLLEGCALVALVVTMARTHASARIMSSSQRVQDQLKTVQHVARIIGSASTIPQLDEMFRLVIEEIRQAFGYQMVSIYLREADGLRLQCAIGYEHVMPFIRLDQGVSGRVARTGRPAFVSDASHDADFIVVAPGTRQAIIVPLKRDSVVLGTLLIESSGTPHLTEDDYSLINTLADQFSTAVTSVQLFTELSESEERTRRLFNQRHRLLEVAQSMINILTLEAIFERFPSALAEVVAYDAFSIYFVDYEAQVLRPVLFRGSTDILNPNDWEIPLGEGILGAVVTSGKGALANNAHLDPRAVYPSGHSVSLEHLMLMPMRKQERVFGVCLFSRFSDRPFSSEDYETAELFISYTSLAISNAQLFDQTQRSEARFRAALDGSLDEFFVFESIRDDQNAIVDFQLVELNMRAERMMRLPRAVLLKKRLSELLQLNTVLGEISKYAIVAGGRTSLSEELQFVRPDGTVSWRHHMIVPLDNGIAITSRDITDRREAENALIKLATLDVLTGVLNRRHFFELAEKELARARRYNHSLAVMMLDIDDFKQVNDAHGHLVGDRVLQHVAHCCRSEVRLVDLLGRYGGEEFIFLFPETGAEGALQTAERLREMICSQPVDEALRNVAVTVSMGIAVLNAGETLDTIDLLVEQADRALYRAKRNGKNRVMLSQPRIPFPRPSKRMI